MLVGLQGSSVAVTECDVVTVLASTTVVVVASVAVVICSTVLVDVAVVTTVEVVVEVTVCLGGGAPLTWVMDVLVTVTVSQFLRSVTVLVIYVGRSSTLVTTFVARGPQLLVEVRKHAGGSHKVSQSTHGDGIYWFRGYTQQSRGIL